jgi:hypothetical protein
VAGFPGSAAFLCVLRALCGERVLSAKRKTKTYHRENKEEHREHGEFEA